MKVDNPEDFQHRVLIRGYREEQTHWCWDLFGSPAIGPCDGDWYCVWHVLPSLELCGHMGIMAWYFKHDVHADQFRKRWTELLAI